VSRSHPVHELADRLVDDVAAVAPMVATYAGIEGHDHRWGDLGPDGLDAQVDLLRRTRRSIESLPPPESPDDALALRALIDHLDPLIEAHEHDDVLRDVAHIASTVPEMRDLLQLHDLQSELTELRGHR
jgi:hypothetical protein